jgi:hypothetical protein
MALDVSQQEQLEALRARLRLDAGADDKLVQLVIRVPATMRDALHAAADKAGAPSTQVWLEQVLLEAIQAETIPVWHVARERARESAERLIRWAKEGGLAADLAAVDEIEDDDTRMNPKGEHAAD